MAQSAASAVIEVFSGLKRDWRAHNLKIREGCIAASSGLWGLLGFLLSAIAYLALTGAPFAPLVDPGPNSIDNVPAPTAAQLGGFAVWRFNFDLFTQQQQALKAFRTVFINSLDDTTRESMEQPGIGLENRTLEWMYAEACRLHGTLTTTDLAENEMLLDVPYVPPQPLRVFIRVQLQAHFIAATNNQPVSEAAKVRRFKAALATCGLFKTCVELFEHDLPEAAQQTFILLATRAQQYDDNRARNATADNTLSAAAVSNAKTISSVQQGASSLCMCDCATCAANSAAAAVGGHKAGRTPVTAPIAPYCWTHGPCGHNGSDCEHPKEGHVKAATLRNPQGGRLAPPSRGRRDGARK